MATRSSSLPSSPSSSSAWKHLTRSSNNKSPPFPLLLIVVLVALSSACWCSDAFVHHHHPLSARPASSRPSSSCSSIQRRGSGVIVMNGKWVKDVNIMPKIADLVKGFTEKQHSMTETADRYLQVRIAQTRGLL